MEEAARVGPGELLHALHWNAPQTTDSCSDDGQVGLCVVWGDMRVSPMRNDSGSHTRTGTLSGRDVHVDHSAPSPHGQPRPASWMLLDGGGANARPSRLPAGSKPSGASDSRRSLSSVIAATRFAVFLLVFAAENDSIAPSACICFASFDSPENPWMSRPER
jgi:hypothetical protein